MKAKHLIDEHIVLGHRDLSTVLSKFDIEDEMDEMKLSDDEKDNVRKLISELKDQSLGNLMMVIKHKDESDIVNLINKFSEKYPDSDDYYVSASDYTNNVDQLRRVLKGELKSREGWHINGKMLDEYLKVGDEVSCTMYDYFINVMPPKTFKNNVVQIGEASDYDD